MNEPKQWHKNEFGQYEGYDAEGKLLATSKPKGRLKKSMEEGKPAPYSKARDVLCKPDNGIGFNYSRKMATKIIDRVVEGETVVSIARDSDMPQRKTIYRWLAKHPEFKAEYEEATKLRTDVYHDQALQEAQDCTDPKEVPIHKLRIDTLKWAAAIGDPNRFNPRPKEENMGNIFIINTGISRPEAPTIDVEHREVTDEKG